MNAARRSGGCRPALTSERNTLQHVRGHAQRCRALRNPGRRRQPWPARPPESRTALRVRRALASRHRARSGLGRTPRPLRRRSCPQLPRGRNTAPRGARARCDASEGPARRPRRPQLGFGGPPQPPLRGLGPPQPRYPRTGIRQFTREPYSYPVARGDPCFESMIRRCKPRSERRSTGVDRIGAGAPFCGRPCSSPLSSGRPQFGALPALGAPPWRSAPWRVIRASPGERRALCRAVRGGFGRGWPSNRRTAPPRRTWPETGVRPAPASRLR